MKQKGDAQKLSLRSLHTPLSYLLSYSASIMPLLNNIIPFSRIVQIFVLRSVLCLFPHPASDNILAHASC